MAVLSEIEKTLLCSVYNTTTECRHAESGELYKHQERLLKEIRGLQEGLDSKYPGHAFSIIEIDPSGVDRNQNAFVFTADGNGEKYHAITYRKQSGKFADDYYGALLRPGFDEAISNILKANELPAVAVYTFFKSVTDVCYTAEQGEAMLYTTSGPTSDTEIFLHGSGKELIAGVRLVLNEEKVCGSFRIYVSPLFASGMTADDCWKLWKEQRVQINAATIELPEDRR